MEENSQNNVDINNTTSFDNQVSGQNEVDVNSINNGYNVNVNSQINNDYFSGGTNSSADAENISSKINSSKGQNKTALPGDQKLGTDAGGELPKDGLGEKKGLKDSVKDVKKSALNSTIKKASKSNDDFTRMAGKTAQGVQDTVKTVKLVKKAAALFSTPVGWVLLIIAAAVLFIFLMILIIDSLTSPLSSKYGTGTEGMYEAFDDEYQLGMDDEKIDSLYDNAIKMCGRDATFWEKLFKSAYDLSDPSDLCLYLRKKVLEKKESETNISPIKPGYLISTFYYAYSTQSYQEQQKLENESDEEDDEVLSDLGLIASLFKEKVYVREDLNKVLDYYIFHNNYTYWTYVESVDEDGETQSECVEGNVNDYKMDDFKYKLYLRYGKIVADAYEIDANKNSSYDKTSPQCRAEHGLERRDVSKYEKVADINTTTNDNAKIIVDGKEYGYDSGFIKTTYPIFKNDSSYNYLVDKEIERIIESISTRQDYTNYVLGYGSDLLTDKHTTEGEDCTYTVDDKDLSNVKIRLLYGEDFGDKKAGDPMENEELIPLEDYVFGVVYHEIGGWTEENHEEMWKAHAIMARSFVLQRPYKHNAVSIEEIDGEWIISIRNGNWDSGYCDPDKGCYYCGSWGQTFTGTNPGTDPNCRSYKGPMPEEAKERMKQVVAETIGIQIFLNDKTKIPGWLDTTEYKMKELSEAGKDYAEILEVIYNGEFSYSGGNCTRKVVGSLTESQKQEYLNKVLEQYPDISEDRIKGITAALDSYGLPYFWGGGHGSLENMLDIVNNKWGKDYCTVTAGGLDSQPSGSQQLCGLDCSGFVRYIMYASTGEDPGAAGSADLVTNPKYVVIEESELLPGDVGVISGNETSSGIGHVGIFLYKDENGKNVYIHQSNGVGIGYPTFTKFRRYSYMD